MPGFRLNLLYKAAALLAAALLYLQLHPALAQPQHVAHYNAVELTRESATQVQFTFVLNLPQVLHQVLAPQLAYPAFLQRYADLPDLALNKEIAKAAAALSAQAYLMCRATSSWAIPCK